MDGITGLTGLNGPVRSLLATDANQATAEQRSGNAADPRHGTWGEQAVPYSWQSNLVQTGTHGPYGPENALLDDEYWYSTPAGTPEQDPTMDRTPYRTHGAPKQRGILSGPVPSDKPNDVAFQLQQSMMNHGIRSNAGLRPLIHPSTYVQQDQWTDFWVMNEGDTRLQPMSRQQMSSHFMFGSRDRTQTMAQQNGYSFDTAHMHRRYATGPIPGNTYWMRPGGRPLVKNIPTVARPPVGSGSPFEGQETMSDYSPQGAYLMATPTQYNPPAQPNLITLDTAHSNNPEIEFY